MEKITSTLRLRMSAKDAHYGGELVDGAHMVHLFGDVATELLIKLDGDDLLNYGEFVEQYKTSDPGAFIQEQAAKEPEPQPEPQPQPQIVLPGKSTPAKKKMTLSEMMKAKNANPNFRIEWD